MDTLRTSPDARADADFDAAQLGIGLALLIARASRPLNAPSLAEAERELFRLHRMELARSLRAAARIRRQFALDEGRHERELRALGQLAPPELWQWRACALEELECATADRWAMERPRARLCHRALVRPPSQWPSWWRLARLARAIEARVRARPRPLSAVRCARS